MQQTDNVGFIELLSSVKTVNTQNKAQYLKECLDFELKQAMGRIAEYKQEATIVLKLKIKPDGKNELNILAEVDSKLPKGKIKQNLFYQDAKGELVLEDPSQLKLLDTKKVETFEKRKDLQ